MVPRAEPLRTRRAAFAPTAPGPPTKIPEASLLASNQATRTGKQPSHVPLKIPSTHSAWPRRWYAWLDLFAKTPTHIALEPLPHGKNAPFLLWDSKAGPMRSGVFFKNFTV